MGMQVRTNIMAKNARRNLKRNEGAVSKKMQKLASGYQVSSAADDAAGLAISEKMKAQIAGLDQASENAQDGLSLVQIAEGATVQIHEMLNRMTTLATKSANGTLEDEVDREAIQSEIDDLNTEITRISKYTNFDGTPLLDGSLSGSGVNADTRLTGGSIVDISGAALSMPAGCVNNISSGGADKVDFAKDTEVINIDGMDIVIDWSTVSKEEQVALAADMTKGQTNASMKNIASIIEKTINAAIDENNKLQGSHIKHISVKGGAGVTTGGTTAADKGWLRITSGLDNLEANITLKGASASVTGNQPDYKAASGAYLAAVFNAGNAANGAKQSDISYHMPIYLDDINGVPFDMALDGEKISVTVTGMQNEQSNNPNWLKDNIGLLNDAIQDALDHYIAAKGLDLEDGEALKANIQMDMTADGRLTVINNSGMTLSFSDKDGNQAAATLGIAKGQAGVKNGGLPLQIGDTGDDFNQMVVSIDDLSAAGIGTENMSVLTVSAASDAMRMIKSAINTVSQNRSNLGAIYNRLEYAVKNLDNTSENIGAANSVIRDANMAEEMMGYTQANVLVQAAQSMLAQANTAPQQILQLLQA